MELRDFQNVWTAGSPSSPAGKLTLEADGTDGSRSVAAIRAEWGPPKLAGWIAIGGMEFVADIRGDPANRASRITRARAGDQAPKEAGGPDETIDMA